MGEEIQAADDPIVFADHVVRLLQNPEYRVEMARKARAAVEMNHAWGTRMQRLDQIVAAAAAGLPIASSGSSSTGAIAEGGVVSHRVV